jgi:hypothetical protein
MLRTAKILLLVLLTLLGQAAFAADPSSGATPREALRPFNDLIGSWKGVGTPEGTLAEKNKGLWQETMSWEWQFKDGDAWLKATFEKGKYFAEATLRHLPEKGQFQLALTTTDRQTLTFIGPLAEEKLIVERRDDKSRERQRLVITLLYDNRFLYHYEVQKEGQESWRKVYRVGATKVGKPLVADSGAVGPLCVVSYGPPLYEISYKGKTYYVCCASCRAEFRADPEKYIKEYEEHLARLAREKAEKKP